MDAPMATDTAPPVITSRTCLLGKVSELDHRERSLDTPTCSRSERVTTPASPPSGSTTASDDTLRPSMI